MNQSIKMGKVPLPILLMTLGLFSVTIPRVVAFSRYSAGANTGYLEEKGTAAESMRLLSRSRREVSPVVFDENINAGVTIFDLNNQGAAKPLNDYSFSIRDVTAGVSQNIFRLSNNRLEVSPAASSAQLKELDREVNPNIEINIEATKLSNPDAGQKVVITVDLTLRDVNDEPPRITNPRPYQGVVETAAKSGTVVFTLSATDPDIKPLLEVSIDTSNPRFAVAPISDGVFDIVTSGSDPFSVADSPFKLQLSVLDRAASPVQKITTEVNIYVGTLPPQFYSDKFLGQIYEGTPDQVVQVRGGSDSLVVKLNQFQKDNALTYQISNSDFEIVLDPNAKDQITLKSKKAFDYESVQSVTLTLTVTEANLPDNAKVSTTSIEISIIDENDSVPKFIGKSQYFEEIKEDTRAGIEVFRVSATDEDSGANGEITFSILDTEAFEVETVPPQNNNKVYIGRVKVKNEELLNFETTKKIEFSVMATDGNVNVPRSSTVAANVAIINVNDNAPVISNSSLELTVPSTATPRTYVVSILGASDVDGDDIAFSFAPGSANTDMFSIDPQSGKIILQKSVPADQDKFSLSVVTTDDGSCCTPRVTKTSTTVVTVNVEDANRNQPAFVNCRDYNTASVLENADIGTSVVTVSAQDDDRGENGVVIYRIDTNSNNFPLSIDGNTGLISVARNDIVRKVEGTYIQVTVIGQNIVTDTKVQLLQGYCTFRVAIVDINNHPPTFEKNVYQFSHQLSTSPATISRMLARDDDFGENANITYTLGAGAPSFFSIASKSGAILLNPSDEIQATTYQFEVIANDNGKPTPLTGTTIVRVEINLGSFVLPSWIDPPSGNALTLSVDEDTPIDTVLKTFKCQSNSPTNPDVEFRVFDTSQTINDNSQFFGAETQAPISGSVVNTISVKLIGKLNYYKQKQHSVTVTCQGFESGTIRAPDIVITVNVVDKNTEAPQLQGMSPISGRYAASVLENSPAGTSIRTIQVVDNDEKDEFKQITFSLSGDDAEFFRIQQNRQSPFEAVIVTNEQFDRENKSMYNFLITASDGKFSDSHFMEVTITDDNDQVPQFAQTSYAFSVSETAEINDQIGEVTATDEDFIDKGKGLEYQFTAGNINNAFTITNMAGQIRLARKLDYENGDKSYRLTLLAYDDQRVHSASTTVIITVLDENDTPPKFDKDTYKVENLVTEEEVPSTPLLLVTVRAVDEDKDREQTKITYSLTANSTLFTVDSTSGEVFLIGKLDRDGPVPETLVTIRAADEPINPLYSYAYVVVLPKDINDNAPVFDDNSISFTVNEHSDIKTYVGTVLARDKDEGINADVKYRKSPTQTSARASFFTVSSNGVVETNVAEDQLDYENFRSVDVQVEAYDAGQPQQLTLQTITIALVDENDQKPYFDEPLYRTTMSEATISGEILRILAKDEDTDPDNRRLRFTFRNLQDVDHFLVSASEDYAVISVNPNNHIDYEVHPHYYKFTLEVSDSLPAHTATTQVEVFVTDFNDNPPVFDVPLIEKTIVEGEPKGALIATFSATDADDGINAEFEYSIDPDSDPFFEFYVDPHTGNVTTRKVLDRELADKRKVLIWAIDKGETPLTGTATLSLTLRDINDNAPRFAEDYRPVIPENEDNKDRLVVTIFAVDPDTPAYGPPFGFEMPSCTDCTHFVLEYDENGDGGNGSAIIRTSHRFDREKQKMYRLPIVISDMNNGIATNEAQSATSTLTVVIGDKNDNKHSPGHQAITFYNFDGQFGEVAVGRVYAEDADDWDLPDKTFTYVSPDLYKQYFSVDGESGVITIKKGVPASPENEPYEFTVNVYDKVFKNTEECTVAVTVKDLTDEALRKAGSIRLKDITAEEFIAAGGPSKPGVPAAPSKMHKFRAEMARLLGYPGAQNIEVVSLVNGPGYLDVRFAGHASPYVTPAQMESALLLNMNSVEKAAGIKVDMVPINLCMEEKYRVGCYTDLEVSGQPQVINGNGSSLTTMAVALEAKDGCPDTGFPDPVECRGDYCFNGGTCVKTDWGNLECRCPAGFDGPRCQQRRHSFDGNSVAFYLGLSACTEGRTSIEFITLEPDGLIMFSGPVVNIDANKDPQDYLILELKGGYPQLRINLGVGEAVLRINGRNAQNQQVMPQLNDGQWHRLDIYRDNQDVILTVDYCEVAAADTNGTINDWSPCMESRRVPGGDVLLNVQSLLQLGGRYPSNSPPTFPANVPTKGFNGCLKDLFHNGKLYDLYYKPVLNWNSGKNGCPREEGICGETGSNPQCGSRDKTECRSRWQPERVESCTCRPGWYGSKCDKVAPIMDMREKSFFQWKLSTDLIDGAERDASVQLRFRSRRSSGTLFALTNAEQKKIDLQLEDKKLVLHYDLGQGEKILRLDDMEAANGAWHVARFERHGNEFQLTLDGGEGRAYTYHQFTGSGNVLFEALPYISAGARVPTVANPTVGQINNDLIDSCIQDVRFNGQWLPMTIAQNTEVEPRVELQRNPNTFEGCTRDDCQGINCANDRVCYPLWGAHECRCVTGTREDANGVCISACIPNPCFNGVTCSIASGNVKCACPDGFSGQYCNIGSVGESDDDGLSGGAIAGIVIGILFALILVVLLVLFLLTCRKKESEKDVLEVDPDDDFIRENVMFYDEEGAGEEDHEAYDITLLQKMNAETLERPRMDPAKEDEMRRRNEPRLDRPDVGSFIDSRIRDTENDDDPFRDVPLEFNYEGGNSDAGSLSSLNTSSSGASQDYDYLNDWGPKFARLADMYGAGQNFEES